MREKGRNKTKAFEFMSLFLMVIGTIIGAGAYIKNNELLEQTKNPIIAIILWVIVGVVCILSVVVFMEISSSTKYHGNGTVGNWSKIFINRRTASFFSIAYVLMYMPSNYAIFAGSFVTFFLQAIGVPLAPGIQLSIYLILGAILLFGFTALNVLKPIIGDRIQFWGTIFKFIPLIVAIIAGFCMVDKSSAMWDNGYAGKEWSNNTWKPEQFLRGFGAILFSFDGYVYICNAQKTATYKDDVPKALFFGMIFVTIFYILIAISTFLGSPDGSIVTLFQKLFAGGKVDDVSEGIKTFSRIFSNVVLMFVCLLNINIFTIIGMISIESDADAKILFIGKKAKQVNHAKSAFVQTGIGYFFFVVFVIIGFGAPRTGWDGFKTTVDWVQDNVNGLGHDDQALYYFLNTPSEYLGIMASANTSFAFLIIDVLIFAAIANRKTKKVAVEKKKGMVTCAIISGVCLLIFSILGIYDFIDPDLEHKQSWVKTNGLWFTIAFAGSLILTLTIFLVQEHLFKKYPFVDGFAGQLSDKKEDGKVKQINSPVSLVQSKIASKPRIEAQIVNEENKEKQKHSKRKQE